MKKIVIVSLILIMFAAFAYSCGAPVEVDQSPSAGPQQDMSTQAPAAMNTPENKPDNTQQPETKVVKMADFTFDKFFPADSIEYQINMNGTPIGAANTGVPGWTAADGKLYYRCLSDGMMRCLDIESGEDTALFEMDNVNAFNKIVYCNDVIYEINSYAENNEVHITIGACKTDGTRLGNFEIPRELHDIEPDLSTPDDPYIGYAYLVKYDGEVMVGVYENSRKTNYYAIDFENEALTPCEAPYTISRDENGNNIVTYRDGSSVTLSAQNSARVIAIGENGDIYCVYYYEPGNHEYRRYSREGELMGVSGMGNEYSPYGETLIHYIEGDANCIYFMSCSDENISLIKVTL